MKPSTVAIQIALFLTTLIFLLTTTQSAPALPSGIINTSSKIQLGNIKKTISDEGLVMRNQLCIFLCSHNDGGDLCKCDMSPLYPEKPSKSVD